MSKYNITINEINTENDQHTAQGTIQRGDEVVAFEAATKWWDGTRRWKVKEEAGLAVKQEQSEFKLGERMAIARWLKEVAKNPELVGKASGGGTGRSGGGSSKKVEALQAANDALKTELSELRAMMQQVIASQSQQEPAVEPEAVEPEATEAPAKPKRKSRAKKK